MCDSGILVLLNSGIMGGPAVKSEWKKKVKASISEEDWELMEKIVTVLQVIVVEFVTRWRF